MQNSWCKICKRSDRFEIDKKIAAGISYRKIAAEYGLSLGPISRHKRHVGQAIVTAYQAEKAEHGRDLLDRVEGAIAQAQGLLETAKGEKSYPSAVAALNSILRALELIARLTGQLNPGTGVSVHINQQINVSGSYDDDVEFARMVGEATKNFSVEELTRLRAVAEGNPDTATIDITPRQVEQACKTFSF